MGAKESEAGELEEIGRDDEFLPLDIEAEHGVEMIMYDSQFNLGYRLV